LSATDSAKGLSSRPILSGKYALASWLKTYHENVSVSASSLPLFLPNIVDKTYQHIITIYIIY